MRTFTIAPFLAILAASAVMGQTSNPQLTLVSDHPAVKAAVEKFAADQAVNTASGKNTGSRYTSGLKYGGGYRFSAPPVALRLNRVQYEERDALQASLYVLATPGSELPAGPVTISVLRIHVDSYKGAEGIRGTYAGMHVLLPGQIIPLETYIFDGSEPSGLYAYVVLINDANTGQTLIMPGTLFVFRNFVRNDNSGQVHVDLAEIRGRYVVLRGSFNELGSGQFLVIAGRKFPIISKNLTSGGTYASADLGSPSVLPPGVYDVTLVAGREGNAAYDSVTAPGILRVPLCCNTESTSPFPLPPAPPFPGPPPVPSPKL